jgi:hypothetical protein
VWFDRIAMILELLLLVMIVVQGEYIRYYEREVHKMNRERYEERAKWREAKRRQQQRKSDETG